VLAQFSHRASNRFKPLISSPEAENKTTDHNLYSPEVDWEKVTCPKALTDITGCVRSGETPTSVKSRRPLIFSYSDIANISSQ